MEDENAHLFETEQNKGIEELKSENEGLKLDLEQLRFTIRCLKTSNSDLKEKGIPFAMIGRELEYESRENYGLASINNKDFIEFYKVWNKQDPKRESD